MSALLLPQYSQIQLGRAVESVFQAQAREILSKLTPSFIESNREIDLSHWIDSMADLAKPSYAQLWQQGMVISARRIARLTQAHPAIAQKAFRVGKWGERRKAAPFTADFNLFNPKVNDAVDTAIMEFCRETNATVTGDLKAAIADLKQQLRQGLSQGEALRVLAARVRTIFTDPQRAARIAATETSRAINGGQLLAAKESGVVDRKRWLASADACEKCSELDMKTVKLEEPFIVLPKGGPYAVVMGPPLHPWCQCSVTEVLAPVAFRSAPKLVVPITIPDIATRIGIELSSTTIAGKATPIPWDTNKLKSDSKGLRSQLAKDADAQSKAKLLVKATPPADKDYKKVLQQRKEINSKAESFQFRRLELDRKLQTKLIDFQEYERRRRELFSEVAKLTDQLRQVEREQFKIKDRIEMQRLGVLQDVLSAENKVQMEPVFASAYPLSDAIKQQVNDVCSTLSKIMGSSSSGESKVRVQFGGISPYDSQRSYAQAGDVFLDSVADRPTILHEIGHALEFIFPKAAEKVRAFWQLRCGKDKPVKMNKYHPGYSWHEEGYEDGFGKVWGRNTPQAAYVGKKYPGGQTEILSMGLQILLDDPKKFAKEDPEYFALVVGILRGDYR